jgi:tetratricopeptide (TPR) repeat protein
MFMDTDVPQDDPRMESVYHNFERNLVDIAKAAEGAGARVVLCTVGVNEGDWAPFSSAHAPGLDDAQRSDWQNLFDEGVALQESGDWSAAAQAFTEAEAIDDSHGELQYRLGRCLLELGRYDDAKTRFVLARDLDTLRFRADSGINKVIRSVSARLRGHGVLLADTERILSKVSPNGIPGAEFFYDQVHFTFPGAYSITRGVRDQVEKALSESLGLKAQTSEVLSLETCGEQLVISGWDVGRHLKYYEGGLSGPPFTKQYDHADRMAEIRAARIALNSEGGDGGRGNAVLRYRTALETAPNDVFFRRKLGVLLMEMKDYAAAEPEFRHVVRLLPQSLEDHIRLGKALYAKGDHAKAERTYKDALNVFPNSAKLHDNLAVVLYNQGQIPQAIEEHRIAIAINPYRFMLHFNFARTLALNEAPAEAIEELRAAIELRPAFAQAYLKLASLLLISERAEEAVPVLESLIELRPENSEAYMALALALTNSGRTAEAENAKQKASEISSKLPSTEGP